VDIERLLSLLISVTLIEMMVAIGIGVKIADVINVVRDVRLVARAGLANYVGVPAIAVGLLLLLDAPPMVAAGFLILAGCPGAPYGPPFSAVAKGNVIVSVGLMVLLAASSAVFAPLLLRILMPVISSGSEPIGVDAIQIVITLLATQLLPLCGGLALRHYWPIAADRLQKPAKQIGTVLNVVVIGAILTVQFPLLAEIQLTGFAGMLCFLAASWILGWFLGGPSNADRRTMTLTTSIRNVAVGLVIAAGAFPGTPAVTAVTAYGIISLLGSLVLALILARIPPDVVTRTTP